MPGIFGLFDIFAIIYAFRSLQLSAKIWREWQQIKHPPLTRYKKHLAEQASFFVAVPIGVFVHEFGHALATWLFGGRVVDFSYRVFWGFIVPQGSFTPAQDWFISLAGTLGSLIFGISAWLLFRSHANGVLRYFGLRAFRFQVYFSLIYYPVFTLIGFVGDWRSIYDFGATPLASALTVPFHVGVLFLFWRGDRIGWFETVSHDSAADQRDFEELAKSAELSPQDSRLQLSYIDLLRQGGASNRAKHQLKGFIRENPDSGPGYLQLAALQSGGRTQISRQAIQNAEKALSLGLSSQDSTAFAHQLLGRDHLDLGDGSNAINHLNQAIAHTTSEKSNTRHFAQLLHWRSLAHRRLRQHDAAHQDVQRALALVQALGDEKLTAFYRNELDIVEQHAGRPLNSEPASML
jgi:tetratricopeptide (TPR) repeat protein